MQSHRHQGGTQGVRGHQAYTRPATRLLRTLAFACDGLLAGSLVLGGLAATQASAVPRLSWLLTLAAAFAGLAGFSRVVIGRTPGELIWSLSPSPQGGGKQGGFERIWNPGLKQLERQSLESLLTGSILTALALIALGLASQKALFTNPVWSASQALELEPFVPGLGDDQNGRYAWTVAPFYYSLGAWPTRFSGNPVFHTAPYEKGPPQRFPGRIISRWDPPHTKLTFEGPKTPLDAPMRAEGPLARERIAECFRPGLLPAISCLAIREATLARHLKEMEAALPGFDRKTWQAHWFVVRNPALPKKELAQGLRLHAHLGDRAQERYVLITPQGAHQAFILDYPRNESGWESLHVLEKSIRSLRVSDDLNPGRAWIDSRLEKVRMADLTRLQRDPEKFISSLSEVQLLLLSKISVDPATFETYFHLGGLGLTLLHHAVKNFEFSRSDDWKSVARPTVEAAARFAEDVKPMDPRLPQLRNFALEAQKY